METTAFTVKGMTCEHCVAAVTQELSALPGVREVSIDLASGRVAVQSDDALADGAVRAAVDEAGYEVVS
jgi:copper chaperone CopZ